MFKLDPKMVKKSGSHPNKHDSCRSCGARVRLFVLGMVLEDIFISISKYNNEILHNEASQRMRLAPIAGNCIYKQVSIHRDLLQNFDNSNLLLDISKYVIIF